ncbi:hypothetical protein BT69DRAFT_118070 [Atractiella rhizophila]|nr:hypothetical protein BT69DRAFT_118070 [Atractiella rhizophila]
MAMYEKEMFEQEFADSNWFKGKQSKYIEAMEKARARNKLVLTKEQKRLFTQIKKFVLDNISTNPTETISFPNSFPARDRRFLQELADELRLTIAFDDYDDYGQNVVKLGFDPEMLSLAREEADISKLENDEGTNGEWEDLQDGGSEEWEWKEAIERVFKKYDKAEVARDMSEGDIEESYEQRLEEKMNSWKRDYYRVRRLRGVSTGHD